MSNDNIDDINKKVDDENESNVKSDKDTKSKADSNIDEDVNKKTDDENQDKTDSEENKKEEKKEGDMIYQEPEAKGVLGKLVAYKQSILPVFTIIVINLVFSLFAVLTIGFEADKVWAGVLIYSLIFLSNISFMVIVSRNTAYMAYNTLRINKINLKYNKTIVKHKKYQAYRPYKGYVMGFASSLPLIIFVIISSCLTGDAYILFTAFIKFVYSIYLAPFLMINSSLHVSIGLVGIVINTLAFGVGYHINGLRMELQQEMIEGDMRKLYNHLDVNNGDNIDV